MGRKKYFSGLVSEGTGRRAGFNWPDPALSLDGRNVYMGQVQRSFDNTLVNLVVIEEIRHDPFDMPGRWRTDWYFGVLYGPHSGQCESVGEAEEFLNKVRTLRRRSFRTAGKYLEKLIINTLEAELHEVIYKKRCLVQ